MNKDEYSWSYSTPDNSHSYLYKTFKKNILEIESFKNKTLLDLGCGNGSLTKLIAPFFKKTIAIDPSSSGIEQAKVDYVGNIDFQNNYIENITGSFDTISLFEVIEHVYDPISFMKNVEERLNKDGKIFLSTPYHGYIKNLVISLLNGFDRHFDPLWTHGHIKFFSPIKIDQLCKIVGLRLVDIKYSGRIYPLSKSMICTIEKK